MQQRPSPNRRPRAQGETIRLIVLHATYMKEDEEALQRLCDPATEVSCHYYVARDGQITQLVPDEDVAWHAGVSRWTMPSKGATGETLENLNPYSLGIEIGNAGPFGKLYPKGPPKELEQAPDWAAAEPFTEAQYTTLAALLKDLMTRHNLKLEAIVAHSAVAPDRKTDPGPHFDWIKLHSLVLV